MSCGEPGAARRRRNAAADRAIGRRRLICPSENVVPRAALTRILAFDQLLGNIH